MAITHVYNSSQLQNQFYNASPGDLVIVHEGLYKGTTTLGPKKDFYLTANGTASNPIVFSGDGRAILTTQLNHASTILYINANYVHVVSLEFSQGNWPMKRADPTHAESWPSETYVTVGNGIQVHDTTLYGVKVINCFIHNTRQGITSYGPAEFEAYGNIICLNGWEEIGYNGHGHGSYAHKKALSQTNLCKYENNILFAQYAYNFQIYGSSSTYINNYNLSENISFCGADMRDDKADNADYNFFIGNENGVHNVVLNNNVGWHRPPSIQWPPGTNLKLGEVSLLNNVTATGNFFVGRKFFISPNHNNLTFDNNVISDYELLQSYPGGNSNVLESDRRTQGTEVFIKRNKYRPDRLHVAVMNWAHASTVRVNLDETADYLITDVQNYLAGPFMSVSSQNYVDLPMGSLSTAMQASGEAIRKTYVHTAPQFGAFIFEKTSPGEVFLTYEHLTSGKSNIRGPIDKYLSGRASIYQTPESRLISGKSYVVVGTLAPQTVSGRSRIAETFSRTINGVSAINAGTLYSGYQQGKSRLQNTYSNNDLGKSYIIGLSGVDRTTLGAASVYNSVERGIYGAYRIIPTGAGDVKHVYSATGLNYYLNLATTGDFIIVHEGTYVGPFEANALGVSGSPIVISGEGRVLLTNGGQENTTGRAILNINEGYLEFYNLEIASTGIDRASNETWPSPSDINSAEGIRLNTIGAQGVKIVNCHIHDTLQGITAQDDSQLEIYGCLIHNNGWWSDTDNRGYGYNVKIRNDNALRKTLRHNVILGGYDVGIYCYATLDQGTTRYLTFDGNVVANAKSLHGQETSNNMLLGGGLGFLDGQVFNNLTYHSGDKYHGGSAINIGFWPYDVGYDCDVTGNWYVGTKAAFDGTGRATFSNNTVIDCFEVNLPTGIGNVREFNRRTTGNNQFIINNLYDSKRKTIVVYNWGKAGTVRVGFESSDSFVIKDAQNYLAGPILTGVDQNYVDLPFSGLIAAQPTGATIVDEARHTAPEFGVFLYESIDAERSYEISGVSNLVYTVDQNIGGTSRVGESVDRYQEGLARVNQTADILLSGVSRINLSFDASQSGVSNVSASLDEEINGLGNIRSTLDQNANGVARIGETADWCQYGISDIRVSTNQTLSGAASITESAAQTQLGIGDILATIDYLGSGIASVATSRNSDQLGAGRVQMTSDSYQSGSYLIQSQFDNDLAGVANVFKTQDGGIQGVSLVTYLYSGYISGLALIANEGSQSQLGKAAILASGYGLAPIILRIDTHSNNEINAYYRRTLTISYRESKGIKGTRQKDKVTVLKQ